ncbi:hypothetical protein VTO58DRAFT_101879 [Aureobasidium pullulans]
MIATVRVFFNALVMAARTGVGAIARESKARRPKTKLCIGLGREGAEKRYAVASRGTVTDSNAAQIQKKGAEKGL